MKSTLPTIQLPKPTIFRFDECLHFLDRGYDECLYAIKDHRVIKPLLVNGRKILFLVSDDTNDLRVEILFGDPSKQMLEQITNYVSHWFDLNRNLKPFYHLLRKHRRLSRMADQFYGFRLIGIPNLFEALCWCVVGQQINLTFAHKLKRQLVEAYGSSLMYNAKEYHFFPEPKTLAGLRVSDLKALQFSRQKADYVIGIAKQFADGALSKQQLADQSDSETILKQLMKIRGVGEWTANYVMMKSFGKMDCIAYGDTGLQRAVSTILRLERKPDRSEVEALFKPFSGWQSYLNMYLWRMIS